MTLIDHLPWIAAMTGMVYLHWLRTRIEIDRHRRELLKLIDDIIIGYRKASDGELRMHGAIFKAYQALREQHPEVADKLFHDSYGEKP